MKTAVEFLVETLAENGILHSSDIKQAKEIEKQQIIDAVDCGLSSVKKSKYKTLFISKTPEECYNEIFNK